MSSRNENLSIFCHFRKKNLSIFCVILRQEYMYPFGEILASEDDIQKQTLKKRAPRDSLKAQRSVPGGSSHGLIRTPKSHTKSSNVTLVICFCIEEGEGLLVKVSIPAHNSLPLHHATITAAGPCQPKWCRRSSSPRSSPCSLARLRPFRRASWPERPSWRCLG